MKRGKGGRLEIIKYPSNCSFTYKLLYEKSVKTSMKEELDFDDVVKD